MILCIAIYLIYDYFENQANSFNIQIYVQTAINTIFTYILALFIYKM